MEDNLLQPHSLGSAVPYMCCASQVLWLTSFGMASGSRQVWVEGVATAREERKALGKKYSKLLPTEASFHHPGYLQLDSSHKHLPNGCAKVHDKGGLIRFFGHLPHPGLKWDLFSTQIGCKSEGSSLLSYLTSLALPFPLQSSSHLVLEWAGRKMPL